ncbi:MAG: hypothetical protein ABMA25_02820 [Ilumatobacteraceae bacterium]
MNRATTLEAFRRFWWIVLAFAVVGGVIGAIPQPAPQIDSSTTYTATFTILVGTDNPSGLSTNTLVGQIATFTQRGEVPKRAAVRLGQDESAGPGLASQLQVLVDTSSGAVQITTTQDDPDGAVQLVDAFGEELITFIAETQDTVLGARLDKLLERQDTLAEEIDQLQKDLARKPNDALIKAKIDAASRQYGIVTEQYDNLTADTNSITLNPLEKGTAIPNVSDGGLAAPGSRTGRSIIGFLLGTVLGSIVAMVLSRLDRRIRTRSHAESIFGGQVAASIPDIAGSNKGIEVLPDRHDHLSDSYRTLRSVISFSQASLPQPPEGSSARARVTLVVSACAGDGKTAVAANLAAALAETGKRVVAVNADFRRPTLAKRVSGEPLEALALQFEDLTATPLRDLLQRTPVNGVLMLDLTSIKAPPGSLARATMRVLPAVVSIADAVVIDSSPVGITAEILDLLPLADTIVVVMRLDHTFAGAARHTMDLMRSLSSGTLMLALVGDSPDQATYYEYGAPSRQPKQLRSARSGKP